MEHLVRLIEILAWPGVVVFALISLRKPIESLMPGLQRVRYKELEIEFERDLDRLQALAHEAKKKALPNQAGAEESGDFCLDQVRSLGPRAAILESWIGLEATAVSTATHFRVIDASSKVTGNKAILALKEAQVLDEEDVSSINELRSLRNKAVHEINFQVSENDAAKFLEIARDLSDVIASEAWQKLGGCSG